MADIAELNRVIEENPDEHEQRWLLVKKLYGTGEFRVALKHLHYLRENWAPKLNVVRYLAATYYRLGRYDEAIVQLQDAIREWPDEIPVREQLARVFEITGQDERAGAVWREILELRPDNATAQHALARKNEKKAKPALEEPPPLKDHEMGLDLGVGMACPNCGTVNTEDFERCWKCHGVISLDEPLGGASPKAAPKEKADPARFWTPLAGAGVVVFLAWGAFLSVKEAMTLASAPDDGEVFRTMYAALDGELLLTRMILGLMVLVVWPLALWIGAALLRCYNASVTTITATGMLLASVFFVVLWLPPQYLPYLLLLLLLVSALPILAFFETRPFYAFQLWAIQAAIVVCVVAIGFVAREGVAALAGLPAMVEYARNHDAAPAPGVFKLPAVSTPADTVLEWQSTGSAWLDSKTGKVSLTLDTENAAGPFEVELKDASGTVFYDAAVQMPLRIIRKVLPTHLYHLVIKGATARVTVTITGALEVKG